VTAPRRDNGLRAASYEQLVDVETHLVDGLLERLREDDVAAYSAPTPGRRGPYGDTVPPLGPSDAVWVDSSRRDQARAVTDRYLEEVAAELAWAGIVADFEREPADTVPRWPASEDVDDEPSGDGSRPTDQRALPPTPAAPPPQRARRRTDDDEDHFEPPPPPPLPQVDRVTRFAWAGAVGGPLVLVLASVLGIPLGGWIGFLVVLAFMAGFVTLVARMKDRPPTDSGPDDGAVV
jgi:hypothetical protein